MFLGGFVFLSVCLCFLITPEVIKRSSSNCYMGSARQKEVITYWEKSGSYSRYENTLNFAEHPGGGMQSMSAV